MRISSVEVPSARDNGRHAIIWVIMGFNAGVCRHFELNRVYIRQAAWGLLSARASECLIRRKYLLRAGRFKCIDVIGCQALNRSRVRHAIDE